MHRYVRFKGSGLSCANHGKPPPDQYSGVPMTIRPPVPVTTHFAISGQFASAPEAGRAAPR